MSPTPSRSTEDATESAVAPAPHRAIAIAGLGAVGLGIAALSFHALAPAAALASCLLGWAMLSIAAIDARRFMIPDVLSLPAIPAGLLASGSLLDPAAGQLVDLAHVLGAGLGAAALWLVRWGYARLRGREGLGLGDVKLAAAGGAWVGWEPLADVVLLAAGAALAVALALAVLRRESLSATQRIAFGVFLAPSIWVVWLLRAWAGGL